MAKITKHFACGVCWQRFATLAGVIDHATTKHRRDRVQIWQRGAIIEPDAAEREPNLTRQEEEREHHRPDASGYSRADEDWFFDMDGRA